MMTYMHEGDQYIVVQTGGRPLGHWWHCGYRNREQSPNDPRVRIQ